MATGLRAGSASSRSLAEQESGVGAGPFGDRASVVSHQTSSAADDDFARRLRYFADTPSW